MSAKLKEVRNEAGRDWKPLERTSGTPMTLAIRPDADSNHVTDLLHAKLAHLEAMLMATYGESGEDFRGWNDTLQDNFMWACGDLATECRALFGALDTAQRAES
jgi:hypothetical protein